jgi:GMP synthase-like glutamine amidotransferase
VIDITKDLIFNEVNFFKSFVRTDTAYKIPVLYLNTNKIHFMKKLKIHYLQHVSYEGLGSIEEWIKSAGHILNSTRFFENDPLPALADFDWLIIMGGRMSVNDEDKYPWLKDEKLFIKNAISTGKTVIGICLGSQLISSALGARVYQNKEKEIGWFDIELSDEAQNNNLFHDIERKLKVFHWHGDTFDLPENAVRLASSEACKNQAYLLNEKVLALQFHLEPTLTSLQMMIGHGMAELKPGRYIQTEPELTSDKKLFESNRRVLHTILTRLAEQ